MAFKRTTVITICLAAFLLGLGYARTGNLISYELVVSIGLFFIISAFRKNRLTVIFAILFGFSLGWVRGQLFLPNVEQLKSLDDMTVTAIVTATSDTYYNSRGQLSFDANNIHIIEPYQEKISGRMTVSGYGEPMVFNGDTLRVKGRLYTTRGSKQLGMSFAQIERLQSGGSWVDTVRRKFTAGLASSLPEPVNSLGIGLLIGQRSGLPDKIEEQLSVVGLTHIVAVSGYNLTIIVNPIKSFLRRRSKYQIALVSYVLIVVFLLMTGFQASIVRAAVVSGLSLAAWYYGRTIKPLLLLCLAAALTAGVNPFYIWSDIGWYLSFLAFFGVLVVAPTLQKKFYGDKNPKVIGSVILESLSAIFMTLPLIMFIFGRVSTVAIPANLLVVPLVPFAMLFSAIAGLAGVFLPSLSGILALPANVLMTAMLDIVYLFSRVPNALKAYKVDVTGMMLLYFVILFTVFIIWRKNHKIVKITG